MFDVDPKWAELVKERGNLPHDLQKRLPGSDRSSVNKGKSPGRPPMMPSPTNQQSASQANLAATSMASSLNFPSLGNLNNSLLSGLSLGNFDPKNNPLLMPFGGLPNLGALSGLSNLSNLSNMSLTNSLFANLAGLGLPSLAGMEAALSATATSTADTNPAVSSVSSKNTSSSSISNTGKPRNKLEAPTSKTSVPSTSSASSALPTTTPFPFFFPNPSLLYTPLGLGGLNPFSMQPGGVSSAYESLAQCGLLNPPTSSASTVRKPASSASSSRQRDTIVDSSSKRKDSEKKPRYPVDPGITLQQYTDMALHTEDRRRMEHEKREAIEQQNDITDVNERRLERKSKEQEMKEALEHLSRTSAELLTRNLEDVQQRCNEKRSHSIDRNQNSDQQQTSTPLEVTLEPVAKKMRSEIETIAKPTTTVTNNDTPSADVEPVARSTSTTKQLPQEDTTAAAVTTETPLNASKKEPTSEAPPTTITNVPSPSQQASTTKADLSNKSHIAESEEDGKGGAKAKKSRSGKRLSIEPPPERKNLRSSAGRQARAAAERQARLECELQSEHQQQQQHHHQSQEQSQQQTQQQQDSHVGNE